MWKLILGLVGITVSAGFAGVGLAHVLPAYIAIPLSFGNGVFLGQLWGAAFLRSRAASL